MTSENARPAPAQHPGSASENTPPPPSRRGATPTTLPATLATTLEAYAAALAHAPLSDQTRRTYASKVRQYLAWLQTAVVDGDPLTHPAPATGPCATTALWRASRSTPARASPRPSPSMSTTSACRLARAPCGCSARAPSPATSRSTPNSARTSAAGSPSARCGPAPTPARRCSSTAAAAGSRLVARRPSSPASPRPPPWTTPPPPTSCGTPAPPSSCVAAPTWSPSPKSSAMPVWRPSGRTPSPPRRTTSKRWSYSRSIADQPYGTFPAYSGRPRFEIPVGEDLTRVLGRGVLPVQIAESWAGQGWVRRLERTHPAT